MCDAYKRNAHQNKWFFFALHSPHSPKPNHKACMRPKPAHWRQLGLLLIKPLWLWQKSCTKWKNWGKLYEITNRTRGCVENTFQLCLDFHINHILASCSHEDRKERVYAIWDGKFQITHGSCHYSLFSITPLDIQGGRISLWISSRGVSSIFFLCAKVLRGIFPCHLRNLGCIMNCCSCRTPTETFYVIFGHAKIKQNMVDVAEDLKWEVILWWCLQAVSEQRNLNN